MVWVFFFFLALSKILLIFLCVWIEYLTLIFEGTLLVTVVWNISLHPFFIASFSFSSFFISVFFLFLVFTLYTSYPFPSCAMILRYAGGLLLSLLFCCAESSWCWLLLVTHRQAQRLFPHTYLNYCWALQGILHLCCTCFLFGWFLFDRLVRFFWYSCRSLFILP